MTSSHTAQSSNAEGGENDLNFDCDMNIMNDSQNDNNNNTNTTQQSIVHRNPVTATNTIRRQLSFPSTGRSRTSTNNHQLSLPNNNNENAQTSPLRRSAQQQLQQRQSTGGGRQPLQPLDTNRLNQGANGIDQQIQIRFDEECKEKILHYLQDERRTVEHSNLQHDIEIMKMKKQKAVADLGLTGLELQERVSIPSVHQDQVKAYKEKVRSLERGMNNLTMTTERQLAQLQQFQSSNIRSRLLETEGRLNAARRASADESARRLELESSEARARAKVERLERSEARDKARIEQLERLKDQAEAESSQARRQSQARELDESTLRLEIERRLDQAQVQERAARQAKADAEARETQARAEATQAQTQVQVARQARADAEASQRESERRETQARAETTQARTQEQAARRETADAEARRLEHERRERQAQAQVQVKAKEARLALEQRERAEHSAEQARTEVRQLISERDRLDEVVLKQKSAYQQLKADYNQLKTKCDLLEASEESSNNNEEIARLRKKLKEKRRELSKLEELLDEHTKYDPMSANLHKDDVEGVIESHPRLSYDDVDDLEKEYDIESGEYDDLPEDVQAKLNEVCGHDKDEDVIKKVTNVLINHLREEDKYNVAQGMPRPCDEYRPPGYSDNPSVPPTITIETVEHYLGCTVKEFVKYLLDNMAPGMSKSLYLLGKISIDHIMPRRYLGLNTCKTYCEMMTMKLHWSNHMFEWKYLNCNVKQTDLVNAREFYVCEDDPSESQWADVSRNKCISFFSLLYHYLTIYLFLFRYHTTVPRSISVD